MLFLTHHLNSSLILISLSVLIAFIWLGAYANDHKKVLKFARSTSLILFVVTFVQLQFDHDFATGLYASNLENFNSEVAFDHSKTNSIFNLFTIAFKFLSNLI